MSTALRLMAGATAGGLLFIAFQPPFDLLRFAVYSFAAWSYAYVCLALARRLEP